jgi:hypothetical protein
MQAIADEVARFLKREIDAGRGNLIGEALLTYGLAVALQGAGYKIEPEPDCSYLLGRDLIEPGRLYFDLWATKKDADQVFEIKFLKPKRGGRSLLGVGRLLDDVARLCLIGSSREGILVFGTRQDIEANAVHKYLRNGRRTFILDNENGVRCVMDDQPQPLSVRVNQGALGIFRQSKKISVQIVSAASAAAEDVRLQFLSIKQD